MGGGEVPKELTAWRVPPGEWLEEGTKGRSTSEGEAEMKIKPRDRQNVKEQNGKRGTLCSQPAAAQGSQPDVLHAELPPAFLPSFGSSHPNIITRVFKRFSPEGHNAASLLNTAEPRSGEQSPPVHLPASKGRRL